MIDDDEDDREIFQEAIQKCSPLTEVIFANDGVEALRILRSAGFHPDVIFLDYNMPRMDGIQCLLKLKSNRMTKTIPTVMYTTSGNRVHREYALSLGADYFMKKSNTLKELCIELDRLLLVIDGKHTEWNSP